MKPKPLLHKDLVNLGVHELKQGSTLNQVEEDFLKKGIKRKDALKAIEEADYYRKQEELKAKQAADALKKKENQNAESKQASNQETLQKKEKSSFWVWFFILVLIGIILYLYFSDTINFDWLRSITFK